MDGEITEGADGSKQWYFVELLMRELGTLLNNDHWSPCGAAITGKFNNYEEFKYFVIDSENTIPIPLPDDFPTVWTIRNSDLDIALAHVKKDYEHDAADQFENWVTYAKERQEDLVLYLY